jgi:hypothetical protein
MCRSQVGQATLEELHRQRDQINDITEDVMQIDSNLARAEKVWMQDLSRERLTKCVGVANQDFRCSHDDGQSYSMLRSAKCDCSASCAYLRWREWRFTHFEIEVTIEPLSTLTAWTSHDSRWIRRLN